MIGRLIGWIIFLAGAAVLVRDGLVWIDTKHWEPIALGQLWFDLDRTGARVLDWRRGDWRIAGDGRLSRARPRARE